MNFKLLFFFFILSYQIVIDDDVTSSNSWVYLARFCFDDEGESVGIKYVVMIL